MNELQMNEYKTFIEQTIADWRDIQNHRRQIEEEELYQFQMRLAAATQAALAKAPNAVPPPLLPFVKAVVDDDDYPYYRQLGEDWEPTSFLIEAPDLYPIAFSLNAAGEVGKLRLLRHPGDHQSWTEIIAYSYSYYEGIETKKAKKAIEREAEKLKPEASYAAQIQEAAIKLVDINASLIEALDTLQQEVDEMHLLILNSYKEDGSKLYPSQEERALVFRIYQRESEVYKDYRYQVTSLERELSLASATLERLRGEFRQWEIEQRRELATWEMAQ